MKKSNTNTNTKQTRKAAKHKFDLLKRLIADVALSPAAKVVAAVLLLQFHNTKTGQCNPSFATIGERSGRSRSSIIRDVAELERTGWIAIVSTKGGSSSNTNQFKFDFARVSSRAIDDPVPDFAKKRSDDAPSVSPQAFDNADDSATSPVSPVTPLPVSALTPVADIEPGVSLLVHEPRRTTPPTVGGWRESDSASAASSLRSPLLKIEEEVEFRRLCQLWPRYEFWPDFDEAKCRVAFAAVCAEHGYGIQRTYGVSVGCYLLDRAQVWIDAFAAAHPNGDGPRYLKKLEVWLGAAPDVKSNGMPWWSKPPTPRVNGAVGGKPSLMALALNGGSRP